MNGKAPSPLLPVAEARARLFAALTPTGTEWVPFSEADGRVLAADILANRTQPPFDASAMDGYAVRAEDLADHSARLEVIGESVAGQRFSEALRPGTAVRIFTGAPMPEGADAIVLQEDVDRAGDVIAAREAPAPGRWIRPAGLDFKTGETVLRAGTRLGAADVALLASVEALSVPVRRRPVVAILATGDELVRPGSPRGPDQIVASNTYGLAAQVRAAGGIARDLGIAGDTEEALRAAIADGAGADMLVTLGGASVGDRDLVGPVLRGLGMTLDFWKIAMRPGKPLMFGMLGAMPVLGLPGNPVSSLVCGALFAGPAIRRLAGEPASAPAVLKARLGCDLRENDRREDYLRASLSRDDDGTLVATPFARQDSSMLALLSRADALVVRPPHAPPAHEGDSADILLLRAL
ncbi:MAG: molybdopterin molybdotransferase MoeA [Alphaproteobacteria bacterium]|nr:molybdopterin molybdotransferase MoeA [Alphaproteobacteria bacterium]MDX5370023.1 molybdopterin molybdotransferase MoeA [Alphaproteobacteria bacterium]MDX5464601.1 molybdopterin molybdotransferase MoeA [Alphaproteobacteria bacterium]